MRTFTSILILLTGLSVFYFTSCKQNTYYNSEDCANYDYSDCNTTEPLQVGLNIKLTINDENIKVPITIYEGKIEDNLIVLTDTVSTSKYNILLPPDKYYSVKARYKKGDKIIYAIGGDHIKKSHTKVCDSTCWSTEEGNINIELKQ
jgi:hypothetical protein